MILHQEDNRQVKSPEQPSVTAAAAVLATPGEASVEDNNPEADVATDHQITTEDFYGRKSSNKRPRY